MDLKQEFAKTPKEFVYNMYVSLVYDYKDYDNITRTKMLDEIIKEYCDKDYLYHICTKKELDFLGKFQNKKLSSSDIEKYDWEIRTLNKKCIFSRITFEVFEEQKNNVKFALDYYKTHKEKGVETVLLFMIGFIKTHATLLKRILAQIVPEMFNISEVEVEDLFGHPLFKFYCAFTREWVGTFHDYEEAVVYRGYLEDIPYIDEERKQYGIAGTLEINVDDFIDVFYYGMPLRKESVKRMYDEVKKHPEHKLLFDLIDEVRLFNDREILHMLCNDDKTVEVINEGLDDIPCAAMNGFTPKQFKEEKELEKELQGAFTIVPQNNAHLCKRAADEFYKVYFALLEYTNDKYNITNEIKKIYKQEKLDVRILNPIDEYLWEHKNILDEFIKENKYNFSKEELEHVEGFKNAIARETFVIVGFEREYTKILSEDGKIYMVKGIRVNFDKIIDSDEIPKMIKTTLLMFKGNIIFNSFFSVVPVGLGNDMTKNILKECKNALKYYHL